MIRRREARASQDGFTLLEVLVAIAILALLTSALVGITRFAMNAWERTAARTSSTEALVRIDRTLRRQITAIVSAGALGEVKGNPPLFFGAGDGFGWVARTPALANEPGLYGQRVRVVPGRGLLLESWPIDRPDSIDTAPLAPTGHVRFAYFGSAGPQEPPRWHARWAAGPIPPRLVRIEFPGAGRTPALTFAIP